MQEQALPFAGSGLRIYRDLFAFLVEPFKTDDAIDQGVQGMIPAAPDVKTGMNDRTPLAHDYRAAFNELASEPLDSQPFRLGIASVPC